MTCSVLLIDNYDSFTHNLIHYLEELGAEVTLVRNDDLTAVPIDDFQKILISPGPGLPQESGQLLAFLKENYASKPMFGICLGQQALASFFGGKLTPLPQVKHGVSTQVTHAQNDILYKDIPASFQVGLYFSWATTHLPPELTPTAFSTDGVIMSFKHRDYDLKAVQYHPESIMTPVGKQILKNWLEN